MSKVIRVKNLPCSMDERISQMLTEITCDTRLELALNAIELSKEALNEALILTIEINDGHVPDITGLDDKIESSLSAIEEVMNEDFSIKPRKRLMKRLVRRVEEFKEK